MAVNDQIRAIGLSQDFHSLGEISGTIRLRILKAVFYEIQCGKCSTRLLAPTEQIDGKETCILLATLWN